MENGYPFVAIIFGTTIMVQLSFAKNSAQDLPLELLKDVMIDPLEIMDCSLEGVGKLIKNYCHVLDIRISTLLPTVCVLLDKKHLWK